MNGSDGVAAEPGGALVTGGSKGIGYAIARQLALKGHNVLIAARDRDRVEAAAARLAAETGARVRGVSADVGDRLQAADLIAQALEFAGSLRVLVNNVGGSAFGTILEITDEQWDHAFGTKFFAAVATMRAAIPHMIAQGGGAIVSIAGTGGVQVNPVHMAGGAANLALIHLTKTVSHQVGRHGIRVNVVSPGPIATERWEQALGGMAKDGGADAVAQRTIAETPLGRIGRPDDVARAVAFLASDDAGFITGQHLIVDGGRCRAV